MRPTGRADIHFRAQPRRQSCIGPAEGAYPLLCAAAPPIVHGADGGACARFPIPTCRRLRMRPAGAAYPLPLAAAPRSRMRPARGACARFPMQVCRRLRMRPTGRTGARFCAQARRRVGPVMFCKRISPAFCGERRATQLAAVRPCSQRPYGGFGNRERPPASVRPARRRTGAKIGGGLPAAGFPSAQEGKISSEGGVSLFSRETARMSFPETHPGNE